MEIDGEPIADALLPPAMARKAAELGEKNANLPTATLFGLAVLAGAFIALGALVATTVVAGAADMLPYGISHLLAGLVFSLGLILVIVGGAELFTGNTLLVMAWASWRVSLGQLLRNWLVVYVGNFVGAVATAGLVFVSGQYSFGGGAIGRAALQAADAKLHLGFVQAIALGILCNALVCLAVWLSYSARSTTDRILAIVPPITAFVAAGFEHSIANMYSIPIALLIRRFAPGAFWTAIGEQPTAYPRLTPAHFVFDNLLPVTLGNVIGGAALVGAVYWFIYLRTTVRPPAVPLEGLDLEPDSPAALGGTATQR
jgi:formate transporter